MQLNSDSLGLLTDLYQLTMGYGYFKTRQHEKNAVFHYFYRRNPFGGSFCIAAGLENFIDFLNQFSYSEDDVQYLSTLLGNDEKPLFSQDYLNYLKELKFTASVDAVPEGTIVYPHEPIVRIQGPMIQCQLVETALLNIMNFQTLIATKSARMNLATQGEPIFEFGLRRAQGINGGLSATRASFIGGCVGTSNVFAAKKLGIPAKGTHAHSWIMSFPSEKVAFDTYAECMPNNCVFLVDTYHTLDGVKNAIQTGLKLRTRGHEMMGIRLDSGDLAELSIQARALLDAGGFPKASIVASNDLDEYRILELKKRGAKIDIWGLGTRLVTAFDEPALGGVYKVSAVEEKKDQWTFKVKISEDKIKISNPGFLQVARYSQGDQWLFDILEDETHSASIDSYVDLISEQETTISSLNLKKDFTIERLLGPVIKNGKLIQKLPSLVEIQKRAQEQLAQLPDAMKQLGPKTKSSSTIKLSKCLYLQREALLNDIKQGRR